MPAYSTILRVRRPMIPISNDDKRLIMSSMGADESDVLGWLWGFGEGRGKCRRENPASLRFHPQGRPRFICSLPPFILTSTGAPGAWLWLPQAVAELPQPHHSHRGEEVWVTGLPKALSDALSD